MLPGFYDGFIAKCNIESREYSILASAMVIRNQKSGEQLMIAILCDRVEAARLIYAASVLYPEAVHPIKSAIDLALEP